MRTEQRRYEVSVHLKYSTVLQYCGTVPFDLTNVLSLISLFGVLFQSFYEGKMSKSSLYWKRRFTSSETWATVISSPMTQTHQSGNGWFSGPRLMMSQKGNQSYRKPWRKVSRVLRLYYIVCVQRWNVSAVLNILHLSPVETLHALVNSGVGGAGCSVPVSLMGGSMGPVCLPRRAETFGGFDSHQMNSNKSKKHSLVHRIHTKLIKQMFD